MTSTFISLTWSHIRLPDKMFNIAMVVKFKNRVVGKVKT